MRNINSEVRPLGQIIVVEDNLAVLKLPGDLLKWANYKVRSARNSEITRQTKELRDENAELRKNYRRKRRTSE